MPQIIRALLYSLPKLLSYIQADSDLEATRWLLALEAKVHIECAPLECPPRKGRNGQSEIVGTHWQIFTDRG